MSIVTDNHSICIRARGLTIEDVTESIQQWMKKDPSCKYQVSMGTNYENKFMGFAYLWVEKSSMYYMLLGKKADGSLNILYKEDETFVPKSTMDWTRDPFIDGISIDWEEEVSANIAPMIAIPQPPLIDIRDDIFLDPVRVYEQDQSSYLVCKHLHPSVTDEMLYQLALPYSSQKSHYPKIERHKRDIRIRFKNESYDANFASFFLLKSYVTVGQESVLVQMKLPDKFTVKNNNTT